MGDEANREAVDAAKGRYGDAVDRWVVSHKYANYSEGDIRKLLADIRTVFPYVQNATIAEDENDVKKVKKAFFKMLRKVHPDRNKQNPDDAASLDRHALANLVFPALQEGFDRFEKI